MQQGDLLLQLDDADYRDIATEALAQLQQEQASQQRDQRLLKLAHNNVQLAQTEVNRLVSLGKKSLSSKSRLDEKRQQLLQLQSEEARLTYIVNTSQQRLSVLQSALKRAQRNIQRTRLTAPYTGRVNKVLIEQGDHATPNIIVVNDSLILIDFAKRLQNQGWNRVDVMVEAGRIRPILLTSITTFLGISPLIFFATGQTAFLSPMAVSLGFGLLFATGLILPVITPVGHPPEV